MSHWSWDDQNHDYLFALLQLVLSEQSHVLNLLLHPTHTTLPSPPITSVTTLSTNTQPGEPIVNISSSTSILQHTPLYTVCHQTFPGFSDTL